MAETTSAPPSAARSQKQQFADVFKKEYATTQKVLNAFPPDKASFKPHDRSSSALKLAWTLAIGNKMATSALRGPLNLEGGFPPAPLTFADVMTAYQAGAKELLDTLAATPDARLQETVKFFSGPKQMSDVPVGEMLWFILLDSIHHRGQFSVYLRMVDGKVPSIYGPTADEPWM
jgi:uncharacterized damage-inducible protein DinB